MGVGLARPGLSRSARDLSDGYKIQEMIFGSDRSPRQNSALIETTVTFESGLARPKIAWHDDRKFDGSATGGSYPWVSGPSI